MYLRGDACATVFLHQTKDVARRPLVVAGGQEKGRWSIGRHLVGDAIRSRVNDDLEVWSGAHAFDRVGRLPISGYRPIGDHRGDLSARRPTHHADSTRVEPPHLRVV